MSKKRWLWIATVICFLAVLIPSADDVRASGSMTIYSIYLGSAAGDAGDATLIESNGQYLLMDIGPSCAYGKVRDFLKQRGVTRLSLYYSHMHGDHTGGFGTGQGYDQLLGDFTVDRVYIPSHTFAPEKNYSSYYAKIRKLYKKHYPSADINQSVCELNVGSSFTFGDAGINIIGPVGMENARISDYKSYGALTRQEYAYCNNFSLVARVVCGSTVYLTAGDIELDQEAKLIQRYGSTGLLKADIYKMSHHGYSRSNSADIISYIQPTYTFAPNSGKAAGYSATGGVSHRQVSSSLYNCCQKGFCYLVGNEKQSVAFRVSDGNVGIYRTTDMVNRLSGLVKVAGSDGIFQKYDYYYLGADGKPRTGIQKINGRKYYFGTGGCREYGTFSSGGEFNPWRAFLVDGVWQYRYFVKKTHEMKTGWMEEKGLLYYLDKNTGYRVTGINRIDKKTYCFTADGTVMKNQWVKRDGRRYCLDESGAALTGWQTMGKKTYHFDANGMRSKGLTKIGNKYYYFKNSGRSYYKNTTISTGDFSLYFDNEGILTNVPRLNSTKIGDVKAGNSCLKLKWKRIQKADGYNIYISDKKNGKYKLAQTIENGDQNKFTLEGLKTGKTYYVKIRAYMQIEQCKFNSDRYSNIGKGKVR